MSIRARLSTSAHTFAESRVACRIWHVNEKCAWNREQQRRTRDASISRCEWVCWVGGLWTPSFYLTDSISIVRWLLCAQVENQTPSIGAVLMTRVSYAFCISLLCKPIVVSYISDVCVKLINIEMRNRQFVGLTEALTSGTMWSKCLPQFQLQNVQNLRIERKNILLRTIPLTWMDHNSW